MRDTRDQAVLPDHDELARTVAGEARPFSFPGYVPLWRMMTYGLMLDVVGIVVILAAFRLIVPVVR